MDLEKLKVIIEKKKGKKITDIKYIPQYYADGCGVYLGTYAGLGGKFEFREDWVKENLLKEKRRKRKSTRVEK